ncbi:MAG: carboxypeptidase regulatory-like domain-containing protein [Pirellulaceae bacterium]|nr:carboxypeptidase regulatory-like domain-containing protein [Pirellulaceae bacterium]
MISSRCSDSRLTAAFFLGLGILSGCSGSSSPPLGQVEGTVTLDGQPVAEARVYFSPVEGGRTSEALTDSSGRYVLQYSGTDAGAIVGEHVVRITTYEEPISEDDGSVSGGVPERIPDKYNTNSTLTREVKRGKQTIDLALES